ncbi:MAG: hypothetical protein FJY85_05660, partial [Deltaproteobacteria bacterium]|nr:hypothetical protein [Deltaproteobacteria bacterium]
MPLANLLVGHAARRPVASHVKLLAIANGMAIGVASYYTLLFAPLLPMAMMALLVGIGFLPMAPLFSLVAAIKGNSYVRTMASGQNIRVTRQTVGGLAIALIAIIGMDIPVTVTRIGMEMALSNDAESRMTGLRLLRLAGDEDLMLRFCYQRRGKATDLI